MKLFIYIILELVFFLIFVCYGEFPGFVIWVLLSCACFYINRLVLVKEAQLLLQIQKQEQENNKDLSK